MIRLTHYTPTAPDITGDPQEWAAGALCQQTDPELFFPAKGESPREAKRICAACPVRTPCLVYGMDDPNGIYGGLAPRERDRLRRANGTQCRYCHRWFIRIGQHTPSLLPGRSVTAAESYAERDRVLAEVELAHVDVIAAGMNVLEEYACTGRPFSANQCREQLRAVGVRSASTGALFNAAIKAGIIRRIGWETSTDIGTHAKPVATYEGTGAGYGKPAAKPQPVDGTGALLLFEISR